MHPQLFCKLTTNGIFELLGWMLLVNPLGQETTRIKVCTEHRAVLVSTTMELSFLLCRQRSFGKVFFVAVISWSIVSETISVHGCTNTKQLKRILRVSESNEGRYIRDKWFPGHIVHAHTSAMSRGWSYSYTSEKTAKLVSEYFRSMKICAPSRRCFYNIPINFSNSAYYSQKQNVFYNIPRISAS